MASSMVAPSNSLHVVKNVSYPDKPWLYEPLLGLERDLAVMWTVCTALLSLSGNVFVLMGSAGHGAFKIDKVSTTLLIIILYSM